MILVLLLQPATKPGRRLPGCGTGLVPTRILECRQRMSTPTAMTATTTVEPKPNAVLRGLAKEVLI